MIVVLDSGVLGLLCSAKGSSESRSCVVWLSEHLAAGSQVVLPEIVDYETRRVYEHRQMTRYAQRLDALHDVLTYLPLTTAAMRQAARLWGEARRTGRKTADDRSLDVDMILCAQAQGLPEELSAVVATTNPEHLRPFVEAERWEHIDP